MNCDNVFRYLYYLNCFFYLIGLEVVVLKCFWLRILDIIIIVFWKVVGFDFGFIYLRFVIFLY